MGSRIASRTDVILFSCENLPRRCLVRLRRTSPPILRHTTTTGRNYFSTSTLSHQLPARSSRMHQNFASRARTPTRPALRPRPNTHHVGEVRPRAANGDRSGLDPGRLGKPALGDRPRARTSAHPLSVTPRRTRARVQQLCQLPTWSAVCNPCGGFPARIRHLQAAGSAGAAVRGRLHLHRAVALPARGKWHPVPPVAVEGRLLRRHRCHRVSSGADVLQVPLRISRPSRQRRRRCRISSSPGPYNNGGKGWWRFGSRLARAKTIFDMNDTSSHDSTQ